MKKIFKIAAVFGLLAVGFQSCDDGDKIIDDLQENVERGAILRTNAILSNEFPIGQTDATFSVELEEQDQENGGLLESVDVFVTYADGSPDAGDSTGGNTSEVALRTIPRSDFATGEFGLPRTTLTITFAEMLSAVGLTDDQTFGGDTFTTRLVLNLTDGRSFTDTDVNGNIASGSFFRSPFKYTTPVVCPVAADEFVGDYVLENVVPVDFGNIFREGQIVTLELGGTSVDRTFDAIVFEDLDPTFPVLTFAFSLVCNKVGVNDNQDTGLGCGGGTLFLGGPIGDEIGEYTTGDDSTFTIVVGYNESGLATCATASNAVLRLSKQ